MREKHKDKGLLPPSCASHESIESTVRGLVSNHYATQGITKDNNNITGTKGSTKNPSSLVPSLPYCKRVCHHAKIMFNFFQNLFFLF